MRFGRFGRAAGLGLVVVFALLVAMPIASATSVGAHAPVPTLARSPSTVSITNPMAIWNGQNIGTAASESHAFAITTGETVLVTFTYGVPLRAPDVTTARMQALYFGAVISTDQVGTRNTLFEGTTTGTGIMNWTLGSFTYLLAGVYLLTASLVDSNGTTVWSESFYINATPGYHIESALIVFLVLLGLVELWSIATVGRPVRKGPKNGSAPPTPWESTSPTPGTSPPPPSEAPVSTPPGDAPPGGSNP